VSSVSYPRLLTSAAIQGMKNALAALAQQMDTGVITERDDLLISFQELNELMGIGQIKDIERRFLTQVEQERKYGT
ncbi:MAG: hypothetical protein AB7P02_31150, partial [Alphaproteobacteria bacterium]